MDAAEILVIVPTRGRPQAVPELARAWRDTDARARLLFAVDADDPQLQAYRSAMAAYAPEQYELYVGPRLRMVGTLNRLAVERAPYYQALGFMGDDHRPRTRGWADRFAECLSGGTGVVYGNDLLQGVKMATAVVLTSDIVSALGYMVPPTLVHLCADLVWMDWGRGIGRITYLHDVVIEHMHPVVGKAPLDEGYRDANSRERVAGDSQAYYDYRDGGQLEADLAKLAALL